ncbi:hypothetical protein KC644_03675 [Candidatus Berkelbacteria bacterium]|nr:hypothetical protein [Candidatus Berkelbacteria bacterium]
MYYYILDPPRSREEQKTIDDLRAKLTNLGIAGEFVTASPNRSIEEIAEIGVAKRYTTLVAIGSEKLINTVGLLLAGTPYTFGALPLENFSSLSLISNINNIDEAAEALKYRRLKFVPVTKIEPNKFFFTEIFNDFSHAVKIRLLIDDAMVEADVTQIRIAGNGRIVLKKTFEKSAGISRSLSWITGRKETVSEISTFQAKAYRLEAPIGAALKQGQLEFTHIPFSATVIPKSLKVIVKRDRLAPSQFETSTGGINSRQQES